MEWSMIYRKKSILIGWSMLNKLDCAQRAQSSTNWGVNQKWSATQIQRSRFGSVCLPDCFQNVVDSLLCRRHAIIAPGVVTTGRPVWLHMKNANKYPKIPSAMVREVKKWSRIRFLDRGSPVTTKGNQFLRLVGPIITPSFNETGRLLFH